MFLVSGRVRRRLAASLGFSLALASIGPGVAIACEGVGEEQPSKILTVERAGGPEAVVGDTVKVALETGSKSYFITAEEGEIACAKSEMAGEIRSNPVTGGVNKAEIKLEAFTFSECTTNIPGYTTKGVSIETLPLFAKTVGAGFEIEENGRGIGLEFPGEVGGVERNCVYLAPALITTYRNNNEGELEINQVINEDFNKLNCATAQFPAAPRWRAKYRPLQDLTESRAGKRIDIN